MDSEGVFFICIAMVLCTIIGCCTYNGTKCAELGKSASISGCVEKPAAP